MPDEAVDTSDIPPFGEDFFETARLLMPKRKKLVSLRLDEDVLRYFKSLGKNYPLRINAVLRAYVITEQRCRR